MLLNLDAAVGGIDIDGGVGGDIDIKSTGKSVHITSTENTTDAIKLDATAGGVDVDAALGKDVNIAGGQVALVF